MLITQREPVGGCLFRRRVADRPRCTTGRDRTATIRRAAGRVRVPLPHSLRHMDQRHAPPAASPGELARSPV